MNELSRKFFQKSVQETSKDKDVIFPRLYNVKTQQFIRKEKGKPQMIDREAALEAGAEFVSDPDICPYCGARGERFTAEEAFREMGMIEAEKNSDDKTPMGIQCPECKKVGDIFDAMNMVVWCPWTDSMRIRIKE